MLHNIDSMNIKKQICFGKCYNILYQSANGIVSIDVIV